METRMQYGETTSLCPDVIEWCPCVGLEDIVAYGVYELDEASGTRSGALHIASLTTTSSESPGGLALNPIAELEMAGVYDVAWCPVAGKGSDDGAGPCNLLAVARADGSMQLFNVSASGCEAATEPLVVLEDSILTHLTWGASCDGAGTGSGLAAVGQDGSAHHLLLREDGSLAKAARRQAHEMEVWCVEVPAGEPHLVLTGADDCRIFGWDLRVPPDAAPAVSSNQRTHEAGVTALASDPTDWRRLASGSYDERVRIFDLRALSARQPLAETSRLGDGAYHIAWHPAWPDVLAVAAMRSGLAILRCSPASEESLASTIEECGRYAADAPEGSHGSLAYGVCWQQKPLGKHGDWLAASASFYDKSVHLWSASMP